MGVSPKIGDPAYILKSRILIKKAPQNEDVRVEQLEEDATDFYRPFARFQPRQVQVFILFFYASGIR